MLRHSYTWALLQGTGASAAHLGQCGALINALPVRLLARPRSLPALGQVAAMVEADVDRLRRAST